MKKILLIAICLFIGFGCAKKGVVKPDTSQAEQPAEAQVDTATAQRQAAEEPSSRYSDWEKIPELDIVYFEFDKSELTDASRDVLKRNAEFMKNNDSFIFIVEGNCDERGTVEYNLGLGQRRAMAVREYYGKLGMPLDRITTISYGSEKPAVLGSNEEAWAKNRRAETKARNK